MSKIIQYEVDTKSRQKSSVWEDFTKVKMEDGRMKAKCRHCQKLFAADNNVGTSHLGRHLKRCVGQNNVDSSPQPLSIQPPIDGYFGVKNSRLIPESSREALAAAIIVHEYPINIVNHVFFRRFFAAINPQFKTMSRSTVKADIVTLYEKEKKKLSDMVQKFSGRMGLTLDMWTSIQTDVYMCLTAHFIDDDWKLQKRMLSFSLVPPPLTGYVIADVISMLLNEWNIEKKLSTITLDSCSIDDVVAEILRGQLVEKRSLLLNGRLFHVRCCARILNTIAQDGMSEIGETISKVRNSIKFVKGLPARRKYFKELTQQLRVDSKKRLHLDIPTRWNSTYLMLETALEFKSVFSHLEAWDSNYHDAPSLQEWELAESVCKFLKVFYDVTNSFLGTQNPTTNLYFHGVSKIQMLLTENEQDTRNEVTSNMAKKMKEKFEKYWRNYSLILSVAVVMDPRYKMNVVEYWFSKIYRNEAPFYIMHVRECLQMLFDEYLAKPQSNQMKTGSTNDDGTNVLKITNTVKVEVCDDYDYDMFLAQSKHNEQIKTELDLYLYEPVIDRRQDLDILHHWKTNKSRYPVLSQMACDVLAIPISAVPSESAFNTSGQLLDQYRSSLKPKLVEALICTQDWIRSSHGEVNLIVPEDSNSSSDEDK